MAEYLMDDGTIITDEMIAERIENAVLTVRINTRKSELNKALNTARKLAREIHMLTGETINERVLVEDGN